MFSRTALLGLALALCPALPAGTAAAAQRAEASFTGVVVDRRTQIPIEGAVVRIVTSGQEARSDAAGRFSQPSVAAGPHFVQVRAVGYSSASLLLTVREREDVDLRVEMELLAYQLSPVTVAGERGGIRLRDFEHRRSVGVGVFLTEAEIAQRAARTLGDLLRSVPGVMVTCRNTACDVRMAQGCRPEYFLDGFPATFATGPDFPLEGVRGIEVYRNQAETPTEFQRPNVRCGAVVIWSHPDL